jgi:hypothetical protein
MSDQRLSSYLPQDPREKLALVALCAAGLFVFGGDLWKLAGRLRDGVRNEVRENMPLDLEIERAREMAASLVPDLRRNHEVIVREQVDMEELLKDIEHGRQELTIQREALLASNAQLKMLPASDKPTPTDIQLRRDLRRRFVNFQTAEATLDAKSHMLKCRQEALDKAEQAQTAMLLKKRELEAQVAQLSARVRLIRREGVDSQVVVDRQKLARCEELLRYLHKRLTIAERTSEFSEVEVVDTRRRED